MLENLNRAAAAGNEKDWRNPLNDWNGKRGLWYTIIMLYPGVFRVNIVQLVTIIFYHDMIFFISSYAAFHHCKFHISPFGSLENCANIIY
jgi:hypothetical protein